MTREEQEIREIIEDLRRAIAREKDESIQQDLGTPMRILIWSSLPGGTPCSANLWKGSHHG